MFRIVVSVLVLNGLISAAIAAPLPTEVNDSEAKCQYPVAPYELVDCNMLLKGAALLLDAYVTDMMPDGEVEYADSMQISNPNGKRKTCIFTTPPPRLICITDG